MKVLRNSNSLKQLFFFSLYVTVVVIGFVVYSWLTSDMRTIPLADKTNEAIDQKIWEWVSRFAFIITVLFGILGFFGIKGVGLYIRQYIEKTVDEAYNKAGNEQRVFMLRSQLNEIKRDLDSKKDYKESVRKTNNLFEKIEETGDEHLIVDCLDNLIYSYFHTRQHKELSQLVKEYEDDYAFTHTSWANIAIANMDLYEQNGSPGYRKAAIKAADKAIEKLPDYGTPRSVKLLVYMIEHDRTSNDNKKEKIKQLIRDLLEEVNSGSYALTSYETYEYYGRVGTVFQAFVKRLKEEFPEGMKLMEDRYKELQQKLDNRWTT